MAAALLTVAGLLVVVVWLAFREPGPDPIPPTLPNPDEAFVTLAADNPETSRLLEKALNAEDGGHAWYLVFGENRLPAGRYTLTAWNAPGPVEFDPPTLKLEKRQAVTVRVRLLPKAPPDKKP
jgi:hypothetical protein